MIENNSTYNYVSILSVKPLLTRLFKIDMQEDDIIENAVFALKRIGNVYYETFLHRGAIDANGEVMLPCNVKAIEAVTFDNFLYNTYNISEVFLNQNLWVNFPFIYNVRGYNVIGRFDKSNLYSYGLFTNYSFLGDRIKLDYQYFNSLLNESDKNKFVEKRVLNVIYRGYMADEEGLPLVTEKEAEAIAYYINYIDKQTKFFTGDPLGQSFQVAKSQWSERCVNARIPEHFNQNAMNSILDRLSSWNRKFYNTDYKFNQ